MKFLDVDDQPPYVEVYSHHPLMYLSLTDYKKQACQQVSPRELLYWCHAVQCKIDDVAGRLGLCKMKIMGQFGPSCMFTISPDMPPKQQADVLLTAAQLLRATLSKVLLPRGEALASQITIHAGKYAGGVIGRGSWTYDLFGADVQDIMELDKVNTANCIQVSDAALALMSDTRQFEPHRKVVCSKQEVTMHRWVGQHISQDPEHAAAALLSKRSVAADQTAAAAGKGFDSNAAAQAGSRQMRADLAFKDQQLEAAYLSSQSRQLARMDMLFVAITVLMIGSLAWSSASIPQLLLASCGHWLMPAVAAAWHLSQPELYAKWREPLWVTHRVLSSLNIAAVLACSMFLRQRVAAGLGTAVEAACGVAKDSGGLHGGLSGLMKRGAVITLAESLGFRVRLRVQKFTTALSAAVTLFYVLSQHSDSRLSSPSAPFTDLALRLAVSCLAPTVLLYLWESEERSWFLSGQRGSARKGSAAAGYSKELREGSFVYGLKQKAV